MAFNTYAQGLKIASDLAQRAVLAESSLSSLPPLTSPTPTLQKAFPLYISAAETYSHLLASNLVPDGDKAGIKRKWRLVLERAEKVKGRIEELGGQVGRAGVGDEGEEEAVRRRAGRMNGMDMARWNLPLDREFASKGEVYRAGVQPNLMPEKGVQVEWAEVEQSGWDVKMEKDERWVINQGAGADCSVVAGLGVCLEHNRRRGTNLALDSVFPRDLSGQPARFENGKHVLKLLLNGEWRGIVIDSLLPRSLSDHFPLHATSHALTGDRIPQQPPSTSIGPPWIPLALKAFFLAHGGYSLRGSNPAPDIYAFTGWIPERISLREGFQREKEWDRLLGAYKRGEVLVTLGTGKQAGDKLIPLHAYAVLDITEVGGERVLEIFDPGLPAQASPTSLASHMNGLNLENGEPSFRRTGLFTMTWDEVCSEYDALNLNWDPSLQPIVARRQWSWPNPNNTAGPAATPASHPRYRLSVSSASPGTEIWILLSQHIVSQDRALDDVALHVYEEHSTRSAVSGLQSTTSPYSNAQHVLYRHTVRSGNTSLHITPSRDRGLSRSDFTLHAFGPPGSSLSLERISTTLPFSQSVTGSLTSRFAGGHGGWPSFCSNPQFQIDLSASSLGKKGEVRLHVVGDGDGPWNVKLLWSDGRLVHDVSEESIVADSGPYAYGLAFAQSDSVSPGIYTAIVSSFEPGVTGNYTLTIESALPVTISPIPPEGAGLYHRSIHGKWTEDNTGGRPSLNQYHLNPHVDVLVPSPLSLHCRLHHPAQGSNVPLNLTLFKRAAGGNIGEQVATSGPYSDAISGVRIPRTKPGAVKEGVYVLVPSGYGRGEGRGKGWTIDVWADGPFSLEIGR